MAVVRLHLPQRGARAPARCTPAYPQPTPAYAGSDMPEVTHDLLSCYTDLIHFPFSAAVAVELAYGGS